MILGRDRRLRERVGAEERGVVGGRRRVVVLISTDVLFADGGLERSRLRRIVEGGVLLMLRVGVVVGRERRDEEIGRRRHVVVSEGVGLSEEVR